MPRLQWDILKDRTHEFGIDRGVLYVRGEAGVTWNGLLSFTEKPTGGERTAHYADDQKYAEIRSQEEFEGTIEAFTYPDEFALCDGTEYLQNGLGFTQQNRAEFDFSYRSMVGNGTDSFAHYKIHMVFNATATPTEKSYQTQADTVEAMTFSWDIKTLSVMDIPGKPTSHFVVDTRKTPRALVKALEDILYGSATTAPRMPRASELRELFSSPGPVVATNHYFPNPGFRKNLDNTMGPRGGYTKWRLNVAYQDSDTVVDVPWSNTKRALSWSIPTPDNGRNGFSIGVLLATLNGVVKRPDNLITQRFLVSVNKTSDFKTRWDALGQTEYEIVSYSTPDFMEADRVYEVWCTIKAPTTIVRSPRFYHESLGDLVVLFSEFDVYPGPYDPTRSWFDGSTISGYGTSYSWDGAYLESKFISNSWLGSFIKPNYFYANPGYRFPADRLADGIRSFASDATNNIFNSVEEPQSATGRAMEWVINRTNETKEALIGPHLSVLEKVPIRSDSLITICVKMASSKTGNVYESPTWTSNDYKQWDIINYETPKQLVSGVLYKTWVTFRIISPLVDGKLIMRLNPKISGSFSLFLTEWDVYDGPYDPQREWYDGDTQNTADMNYYWSGVKLKSPSYARLR